MAQLCVALGDPLAPMLKYGAMDGAFPMSHLDLKKSAFDIICDIAK